MEPGGAAIDPAQQSLADALVWLFRLLKLVMLVIVVVYALSNVFNVPQQEAAVRLFFGRIAGGDLASKVKLAGGPYFALPYPFEEVIRVPVTDQQFSLDRAFWFEVKPGQENRTEDEMAGTATALNPERDGSLLTGDANIVHARWSVTWRVKRDLANQVDRQSVIDFVTHVGTMETARLLVQSAAEQALVYAVGQLTADEITRGQTNADVAAARMQRALDASGSGLQVVRLVADRQTFPLSVREAFREVIVAENEKGQKIDEARQKEARTLGEAAGEPFEELLALIGRYERAVALMDPRAIDAAAARLDWSLEHQRAPAWVTLAEGIDPADEARLWEATMAATAAEESGDDEARAAAIRSMTDLLDRLGAPAAAAAIRPIGGQAAEAIHQAKTYRTQIVAQVRGEAEYFGRLLPQYRQNPRIVTSRLWQDMLGRVLGSPDIEVLWMAPGQTWIDLNKNPEVRRRQEAQRLRAEQPR